MQMFQTALQKGSRIVLYKSFDEFYFEQTNEKNEIIMTDLLYNIINEDLFALHGLRIRDCTCAQLSKDGFSAKDQVYYCNDMSAETLVFSK